MQTSTITFEKFTRTSKRTNKPTLATDNTRQCKKSLKLERKLARKNKRFDYSGEL